MNTPDENLSRTNIPWAKVLVLVVFAVIAMATMFTESYFSVRVNRLLEVVVDARSDQMRSVNQDGHVLEWLGDIEDRLTSLERKSNTELKADDEHLENQADAEF